MNRYETVFKDLKGRSRGALVPFLMLGEWGVEDTLCWVDMLVENGADVLELGMPFSDPVADGLVIQQSSVVALEKGATPDSCFKMIAVIREKYPELPMGLLTYANLVVARGVNKFYRDAVNNGLDSVLMADIPAHAIRVFSEAALENNILPILIAPPNATEEQLTFIAQYSRGYTYVVSRSGVTGANQQAGIPTDIIHRLKQLQAPPALLGFGISSTKDVENAIQAGCGGVICGSALVNIQQQNSIEKALDDGARLMQDLCCGLSCN